MINKLLRYPGQCHPEALTGIPLLDEYIKSIDSELIGSSRVRLVTLIEIKNHLEESRDHYLESGLTEDEAAEKAVTDMGEVDNYTKQQRTRLLKIVSLISFLCLVVFSFGVILLKAYVPEILSDYRAWLFIAVSFCTVIFVPTFAILSSPEKSVEKDGVKVKGGFIRKKNGIYSFLILIGISSFLYSMFVSVLQRNLIELYIILSPFVLLLIYRCFQSTKRKSKVPHEKYLVVDVNFSVGYTIVILMCIIFSVVVFLKADLPSLSFLEKIPVDQLNLVRCILVVPAIFVGFFIFSMYRKFYVDENGFWVEKLVGGQWIPWESVKSIQSVGDKYTWLPKSWKRVKSIEYSKNNGSLKSLWIYPHVKNFDRFMLELEKRNF